MEETIDVGALVDGLVEREGGYVANPADKGGPTCFGITEAVARANGYRGAMPAPGRAAARERDVPLRLASEPDR